MLDLLIIGAGLTGLSAAYTAARAGLRVRVIAKGLSSTHWSAGTVDVFGYTSAAGGNGAGLRLVERPLEAIADLKQTQPQHPYALLAASDLADSLQRFLALTAEMGLPYQAAAHAGDNLRLPSPVGAARPAYFAPQAQIRGELGRTEPMLIVGFRGLRDFFPELIAANLIKQGYQARVAFLPVDLISKQHDRNTVQLATALDDSLTAARLAVELKRLLKPGERIGLPAILGMQRHTQVMEDLQSQSGAAVFEIPTLPPSVPGIRLFLALRNRLEALGVRVEAGMEATGFSAANGRVQWVETATSARPLKHRAAKFLLATGGILGGGFNSDHTGKVWDVVFNLPLTVPQARSQWFYPQFLDARGQPVFHGGVAVTTGFRPVNEQGDVVYENVWAAGGVLAHSDVIQERSLEGLAITTGMAAANSLLSH